MLACKCCKLGQLSVALLSEKQNPEQIVNKYRPVTNRTHGCPDRYMDGCNVFYHDRHHLICSMTSQCKPGQVLQSEQQLG